VRGATPRATPPPARVWKMLLARSRNFIGFKAAGLGLRSRDEGVELRVRVGTRLQHTLDDVAGSIFSALPPVPK
jgi:hypothetical protein